MQISGVVVLYNPDDTIKNNIMSYLSYLKKLYVIDNSDVYNSALVSELKAMNHIEYIDNQGNKGIANALNMAANLAIRSQMEWLLTMDQDSKFEDGAMNKMLSYIASPDGCNASIVAPLHVIPNKIYEENQDDLPQPVLTVSTSGNMLNLQAYKNCGPFLEKLFIDAVDHEYCLRLNSMGYKVMRLPSVRLLHNLGELKMEVVFGIKTTVTHHNYIRRYYITRNRLFVSQLYRRKYPKWYRRQTISLWRDLIKIVFAERDKLRKLKAVYRGVLDCYKRSFGKYIE